MADWNARRIVRELADADRRRAIFTDFWRFEDAQTRLAAEAYLAKKLNFRDVTVRKLPPERKADLLAARLGDPETEHYVGMALMTYHMQRQRPLMAAFLDRCQVPHDDGLIGEDASEAPDAAAVRAAVAALEGAFDRSDVRLYLAAAGLLMGEEWSAAMWPVVDELG
jgi:hypothetical protein